MNNIRTAGIVLVALSGWWLASRGYADPLINKPAPDSRNVPVENQLADVPDYAKALFFGQESPPASALVGPACN